MKKELFLQSLICLLAVSCSVREIDIKDAESNDGDVFYASLETYSDSDTRVYVDEHIKILWDADDRISIFNENTMNQQYRFTGDTGDNSGFFKKVPNDDFATGNDMDFICAVYPYLEATSIDNSGVLTLTIPEVQSYREDSFGPGANTMVSSTEDNLLKFKNVGGYLVLKFYGEDVSVSSIMLEGHNGEKLSGTATVKPAVGVIPNITMASTAGTSITLTCDDPVELGTTREDASIFWMVVPPTAFTDGFKLTVTDPDGRVYVKETNADLSIVRNGVLRIAPIEVVLSEPVQPNNVIYYTSTDGKVVKPNYADVFGASIVSNEYTDGRGVITFNNEVTRIGNSAFSYCTTLLSVSLPNSITAIGDNSFTGCRALSSIDIPAFVTSIGRSAFNGCSSLTSITIPDSVISIGDSVFSGCESLVEFSGKYSADNGRCLIIGDDLIAVAPYGLTSYTIPSGVKTVRYAFCKCYNLLSVTIPEGVTTIDSGAFQLCSSLTSITIPSSVKTIGYDAFSASGLVSITIPSTVESIGDIAFDSCRSLKTVIIEEGVSSIGFDTFNHCSNLISITIKAENPPKIDVFGSASAFDGTSCPIYVPSSSIDLYKTDQYWSKYADRIQAFSDSPINFADDAVKAICVSKWDTNGDGELSYKEAAAVSNISYEVFYNNTVITSFDEFQYFTGITRIGVAAFGYCYNLISITIPESVTDIYGEAFYGVQNVHFNGLTAPTLHKDDEGEYSCFSDDVVLHVKPKAYSSFTNMSRDDDYADNVVVDVPENELWYISSNEDVVGISEYAGPNPFGVNLISNTYSNGVGRMVFDGPVCKVEDLAFYTQDRLASVFLPPSVTYIGDGAFSYCHLACIYIPNSVTRIGHAFEYNDFISVVLPSGVRFIDDTTTHFADDYLPFNMCSNMLAVHHNGHWTDQIIQDNTLIGLMQGSTFAQISVPTIGRWGAANCSKMKTVSISSQCNRIEYSAFRNCSALTSISIDATTPPLISTDVFDNTNNCPIRVPASAVNAYKSSWSEYASRIISQ